MPRPSSATLLGFRASNLLQSSKCVHPKLLASTARARLQFLLVMNSLTPKANPEDLDAFDTPAGSMALEAHGIHRIKMFVTVCRFFFSIFRPASLSKLLVLPADGASKPLVTPDPCLSTFDTLKLLGVDRHLAMQRKMKFVPLRSMATMPYRWNTSAD